MIKNICDTLSPLYNTTCKAPSTLMELSKVDPIILLIFFIETLLYLTTCILFLNLLYKAQHKRFKNNSIHVSGIYTSGATNNKATITLYSKVQYGSNINKTKIKSSVNNLLYGNQININKTKGNYVLITSNRDECLNMFQNIYSFDTCTTQIIDAKTKQSVNQSGVVVLMMAALPKAKKERDISTMFDDDLHSTVKKCKPDILKTYNHFGSKGECYAFGNKPNYAIVENSSVGTYAIKKSKVIAKQKSISNDADLIEDMCASVISDGVKILSNVLPDIRLLLSPIVNSFSTITSMPGIIKRVNTVNDGFWNTMLYVDGRTEELHTEKDSTYTLITVPRQKFTMKRNIEHRPMFIFNFGPQNQVIFPLNQKICLIYNGRFVTHRQAYTQECEDSEDRFINISSYGNEKLFNHLRKTYSRKT